MVVRFQELEQGINYSFDPTLHPRDQTKKEKHNVVEAMIKKIVVFIKKNPKPEGYQCFARQPM